MGRSRKHERNEGEKGTRLKLACGGRSEQGSIVLPRWFIAKARKKDGKWEAACKWFRFPLSTGAAPERSERCCLL